MLSLEFQCSSDSNSRVSIGNNNCGGDKTSSTSSATGGSSYDMHIISSISRSSSASENIDRDSPGNSGSR